MLPMLSCVHWIAKWEWWIFTFATTSRHLPSSIHNELMFLAWIATFTPPNVKWAKPQHNSRSTQNILQNPQREFTVMSFPGSEHCTEKCVGKFFFFSSWKYFITFIQLFSCYVECVVAFGERYERKDEERKYIKKKTKKSCVSLFQCNQQDPRNVNVFSWLMCSLTRRFSSAFPLLHFCFNNISPSYDICRLPLILFARDSENFQIFLWL